MKTCLIFERVSTDDAMPQTVNTFFAAVCTLASSTCAGSWARSPDEALVLGVHAASCGEGMLGFGNGKALG